MYRYLPGLLLLQLLTAVLIWLGRDTDPQQLLWQAGVPLLAVSFVTALWFGSIGKADAERSMAKLHVKHAKEREKIQLSAEKEKARVVDKTHKEIRKQERRVGRRANLKVSLAFAGAALAGGVFLIVEFFTLGLLTLSTSLGGLGGYLLRVGQVRQSQSRGDPELAEPTVVQSDGASNPRVIEHRPVVRDHHPD
ncbi:MAG: hypothetical protein V3U65_06320 [Granulosicoccaceae bacterium]